MNAVLQYHGGPGYGDTLITCATIVQSYMMLITSPMLGITGGSQPLISFNYGANKPENRVLRAYAVYRLHFLYVSGFPVPARGICRYFYQ